MAVGGGMAVPVSVVVVVARVVVGARRVGLAQEQLAPLDAAHGDHTLAELADLAGAAAEDEDLQAARVVEVHVRGGDDEADVLVLQVGQPLEELALVVVVGERDRGHALGVVVGEGQRVELVADEAGHPARAAGEAPRGHPAVEAGEELVRQGDAHDLALRHARDPTRVIRRLRARVG